MDRRSFLATALVSGASVSAYGLLNKKSLWA
jgi:hypothetical protein